MRGHATIHLAASVRLSVRSSVCNISELVAVFALLPPPNRPRLWCRVSGLVWVNERHFFVCFMSLNKSTISFYGPCSYVSIVFFFGFFFLKPFPPLTKGWSGMTDVFHVFHYFFCFLRHFVRDFFVLCSVRRFPCFGNSTALSGIWFTDMGWGGDWRHEGGTR